MNDRPKRWPRCECGKILNATEHAAKRHLRAIQDWKTAHHEEFIQRPVRFYQCRYGSWHWTQVLDHPEFEDPVTDPRADPARQWSTRHVKDGHCA